MENSNKTIVQLYSEHSGKVSDKWTRYLLEYDLLFRHLKDKHVRLLEIGVQNGGGLEIWSDYFGDGLKFIGCDINPECAALRFDDPRIHFVLGDANTDTTQEEILSISRELDIVIDDGSHCSGDIIRSFLRYFPNIVDGGIYVAEDLHASYWREYEGGLFDPYSSISFFKRLIDIINSEHWGVERNRVDILAGFQEKYHVEVQTELLEHVHSILFINSLCVILKSPPPDNKLGTRFVAGSLTTVSSDMTQYNEAQLSPPQQNLNPWSTRVRPPDEELPEREHEVKELTEQANVREQTIQSLEQTIRASEQKIRTLEGNVQSFELKLGEIYKSRAWQFVQIIWQVRVWLIPHGSSRERIAESLYRPIRYWRKYGFKALFRRITGKGLTSSSLGMDGQFPGVELPVVSKLVFDPPKDHAGIAHHHPGPGSFPVFLTPFSNRRLNIILDDIQSNQPFGSNANAIILSSLLSAKWDYDLRIVTRNEIKNKHNFLDILELNNISWKKNVEFLAINPDISKVELPVGSGDVFLATSFQTATNVVDELGDNKVLLMLQEGVRTTSPKNDDNHHWREVFKNKRIKFIVNSKILFDQLVADGFDKMREDGAWFEPARPEGLFFPDDVRSEGRKNFFYTNSSNSEEFLNLGFVAIDKAVQEGIFNLNEWNFFSVSKMVQKTRSPHSFLLKRYQDLDWDEYLSLVRKTDLGFSLTDSTFPLQEYHPFDLAASGAVVITNFLEDRQKLAGYSKNFLCCSTNVDEIVQGFSRGITLVQNPDLRRQNFRENGFLRDWQISFHDVLTSMEKWGFNVPE